VPLFPPGFTTLLTLGGTRFSQFPSFSLIGRWFFCGFFILRSPSFLAELNMNTSITLKERFGDRDRRQAGPGIAGAMSDAVDLEWNRRNLRSLLEIA